MVEHDKFVDTIFMLVAIMALTLAVGTVIFNVKAFVSDGQPVQTESCTYLINNILFLESQHRFLINESRECYAKLNRCRFDNNETEQVIAWTR